MNQKQIIGLSGMIVALAMVAGGCASTNRAGVPSDIPIVDTHIHLYDTTRKEGVAWPPKTDKVLYRPVLPKHFDAICQENGIAATVIVEASSRPEINQWVLDLVKHDPKRYIGLVGQLPFGTDEFAPLLNRFAKDKRFVGLRLRDRPGGEKFFTDAVWRDLKLLQSKGLVLDVLLANFSMADVERIAKKNPKLSILINHVTGLTITGKPADSKWAASVKAVAKYPNVHCKISGIFQRSGKMPAPKELSYYKPIFEVVYNAFGEDRIIYGSNWPVTDRGGRYDEQLRIINDFFAPEGRTVLEKLYWKNASKFYGFSLPSE